MDTRLENEIAKFCLATGCYNQDMRIRCTSEAKMKQIYQMKHISMHVASVLLGLMRNFFSMRSCFNKRQSLNINFHHAEMYQNHNDGQIGLCEENMKRETE